MNELESHALELDLRPRLVGQLLAVFLVVICGCGVTSSNATGQKESSLFKNLVLSYGTIVRENQGRLPKNQEQLNQGFERHFREYLAENQMGIDQLLTSPRDGKPYVFLTEENSGRERKTRVVGYEQSGVNGLRYVGTISGDVLEVDDSGFRELVPN